MSMGRRLDKIEQSRTIRRGRCHTCRDWRDAKVTYSEPDAERTPHEIETGARLPDLDPLVCLQCGHERDHIIVRCAD